MILIVTIESLSSMLPAQINIYGHHQPDSITQQYNPIVSVSSSTTYILTGTNNFGCNNSDTITIKVTNSGQSDFELPNAFTPNGNSVNQCFGIQKWSNATVQEFAIYNRWGQRVFNTKDPTKCWDGTVNGQQQVAGAYVYVIKASTFCGQINHKGVVMLIR